MHRKIILGTVAFATLTLIAACNRETASNNQPADNSVPAQTASAPAGNTDGTNQNTQTAQNNVQPGTRNDTVSAAKDAVSGAIGTISAELTTTAKGFVDAAAVGDMYEVQAGQLALMRSHMPELKKFAQMMVDDHTKTSSELKSVLMKSAPDVSPPTDLDARREGMLNDLKGAKDEDFDGRYIAQQIGAHNEAVILMRGYAKDGDNAAIKSFATATLPKVQRHLDMINDIDRQYRASNAQARNASSGSNTTTR